MHIFAVLLNFLYKPLFLGWPIDYIIKAIENGQLFARCDPP